MKNRYILLAASFCLMACFDLDEKVYDQISQDDFGATEQQVDAIIAPAYRTLKDIFPGDPFTVNECASDMAITPTRIGGDWWDGGQFQALRKHTWTAGSNGILESYKKCMNGVATANAAYRLVEPLTGVTNKERKLAEIRGVRAYWFYVLCDMFGNVPMTTSFEDVSAPTTKPRKEVFEFVVKEVIEILPFLPKEVDARTYGHFTQGAAWSLLAKMYLNSEVWIGVPQWQKAADACDSVMKFPYILESDWKVNFATDNEKSKEIIFSAIFRSGEDGNHLHRRTLHYLDPIALGLNVGTWNGISALPTYVRQFDSVNDQRYKWSFLLGPQYDPATGKILVTAHGRDLIHTVDILPNKEDSIWGQNYQESGARCFKWEFEKGIAGDMGNDFALFRLADIYLMKAEALVRLGKNNGEATRLLNLVRARGYGNSNFNKTAITLDDVYLERRLELAWENYTRQDQIRFGTFLKPGYLRPSLKEIKDGVVPTNTPAFRLIYPIPQNILDANKGLKQNPGY